MAARTTFQPPTPVPAAGPPRGRPAARRGFTLVELLVVMAIIALIASVGIYAVQPFQSSAAVTDGGILLQSWLNAAKARAMRDRAPRGLRLLPGDEIIDDTGNPIPTLVTKCMFVEVQSDISGAGIFHSNVGIKTVLSLPASQSLPTAIAAIDACYLEINGGTLHRIDTASGTTVNLVNAYPVAIAQNSNALYRIIRMPQTSSTTGNLAASTQDILRMPKGSAINLSANASSNSAYALSPANPPIDILFSPNGSVVTPAVNGDKIVLWVTGIKRNSGGIIDPRQGQPTLVVVNTRSGSIAGVPANPVQTQDPYSQVP